MSNKFIAILLADLLICGPISFAADKKDEDSLRLKDMEIEKAVFMAASVKERVVKIGLVDCVIYALKNNSDILIERIEPRLKEDDVKIKEADFEPTLSVDYTLHDNAKESTSSLAGAGTSSYRDINFDAGISGKLINGTGYELDLFNQKYKSSAATQTINPYYLVEPKITVTQPLFRGFGVLVNRADILIAKNDKLRSDKNFKGTVMGVISKAKAAYYYYAFYLENYALVHLSLERARDLLGINKIRYSKGLISSVDLLENEAQVAQREKNLISAEVALKKAEDDLKVVTNLVGDPEVWNARVELIDKPELKEEAVDLLTGLKNAFEYRPDYQNAKIDLKNRDIKIEVARNSLFPVVDLIGSFGLNGIDKNYLEAARENNAHYKDWSVGVKFSVPWGTGERAEYDQRKLEKAQALFSLKKLEQDIILEVRDKVRSAAAEKRQIKAAKLSKDKEARNYEAQKERYAAGQISTHDILDYQDKLAQSELDCIKALVDYNISLIALDEAQGLTLRKNDVKLEE